MCDRHLSLLRAPSCDPPTPSCALHPTHSFAFAIPLSLPRCHSSLLST